MVKKNNEVIAIGIALLFAVTMAMRIDPHFFVIPDELATATIAQRVSMGQPIAITDPLIPFSGGLIHPRSMTTIGDRMVPEGFLALGYWYGMLMRIIPWSHLPFIISIATTLGASIALKILFSKFFNGQAFIRLAPWVYPTIPPILYYTFHPYLSNLLQWNLLLIVAAGVVTGQKRVGTSYGYWCMLGMMYGLALSLRPVEALWIVPLTLWIVHWKRVRQTPVAIALSIIGVLIPLAWLGWIQHDVYGAWWKTGYALNPSLGTLTGHAPSIISTIASVLFPFGIHMDTIWYRIQTIAIPLWWWMLFLIPFSFKQRLLNKQSRDWWIGAIVVTLWLLLYYGSWARSEPEDTGVVAMSTGFVRYAIPFWSFVLPMIAAGIIELSQFVSRRYQQGVVGIILGGFIISATITTPASLWDQQREIASFAPRVARVLSITPPHAILVTKRSDKIYFPYRRVIVWYKEPEKVRKILPDVLRVVPVYLVVDDNEGEQFVLPDTVRVQQRIPLSPHEVLIQLERSETALSYE